MPRIYITQDPLERILGKTTFEPGPLATPCRVYLGCIGNTGYGKTVVGSRTDGTRRSVYVHRYVWEQFHGPIPRGLEACHHCDNKRCCNPKHIYAGTRSQNSADAVRRGSHYSPFATAERSKHGLSQGGPARRAS